MAVTPDWLTAWTLCIFFFLLPCAPAAAIAFGRG